VTNKRERHCRSGPAIGACDTGGGQGIFMEKTARLAKRDVSLAEKKIPSGARGESFLMHEKKKKLGGRLFPGALD